ncbi:MAG: prolyl oligopeptidase family serine peptidase [Fimbriimonadaceae bacterium]
MFGPVVWRTAAAALGAAVAAALAQGTPDRDPASDAAGPAPAAVAAPNPLAVESFIEPPRPIRDLVLAPRWTQPALSLLSRDGRHFLVGVSAGLPQLSDLSRPSLNLAGFQVLEHAYRERSLDVRAPVGYELIDARTGARRSVQVPAGKRFTGATFSPDSSRFAFLGHAPDGTYLYVADVESGRSRKVTERPLLATASQTIVWAGNDRIVTVLRPTAAPPKPAPEAVPATPLVRLTHPTANRLRTFPSLLQTPRDAAMLEHFMTGQLAVVHLADGRVHEVGAPALIRSVDPAPDGRHFRVTTVLKPFSYIVPESSFGSKEEIWDDSGKVLVTLQNRPIRADGTLTPASTTRRALAWRPDGQGLSFIHSEPAPRSGNAPADPGSPDEDDEQARGRAAAQAAAPTAPARPDRVMQWLPPFRPEDAKVVYASDQRINSVRYSPDCQILFLSETRDGREVLAAVRLSDPSKRHVLASSRAEDWTQAPGDLVSGPTELGTTAVRISSRGTVFLSGTQQFENPAEKAPRPFLDEVEIDSGKVTRLWQSPEDRFESITSLLGNEGDELVITRQSPTEFPNQFYVNLADRREQALTEYVDLTPEIGGAIRHRFQVRRADGFRFWVQVTLPRWHTVGSRLPAMINVYPREFENQAAYDRGERGFNKNLFPRTGANSWENLVVMGYAVVRPDIPIVGPAGRMNDNYVHDLRNSLAAVIDEIDRRGWVDRRRLSISGHSYGGFTTANAMIHTPFFRAGIAGAGNYNRTLTPMAFQGESRNLTEARETYLGMSPLIHANNLTGALLLYHGAEDQNVGTWPINSERMFHMLESLGKTAALYMYPFEDHGQIAEQTLLDMWARWVEWLERHVRPVDPS